MDLRKIITVTLTTDKFMDEGLDDALINECIRKDLEAAISLCGEQRYKVHGMTVLNRTTCADCQNRECVQWGDESEESCAEIVHSAGFLEGWTDIQTKYVKENIQNGKV